MVFRCYFSWAPGEHSHGKDLGCLGGTFPVGNLDTYPALKFLVPQRSFPSHLTSSPESFRLGELLGWDHVSDSTDKWETDEPPCWYTEGDNRRERPDAGTCCKENYWSSQLTRFGCFPGCESPPRFFGCSAGNGNGGLDGAHPPQVLVVSPSRGRMARGTAASCLDRQPAAACWNPNQGSRPNHGFHWQAFPGLVNLRVAVRPGVLPRPPRSPNPQSHALPFLGLVVSAVTPLFLVTVAFPHTERVASWQGINGAAGILKIEGQDACDFSSFPLLFRFFLFYLPFCSDSLLLLPRQIQKIPRHISAHHGRPRIEEHWRPQWQVDHGTSGNQKSHVIVPPFPSANLSPP